MAACLSLLVAGCSGGTSGTSGSQATPPTGTTATSPSAGSTSSPGGPGSSTTPATTTSGTATSGTATSDTGTSDTATSDTATSGTTGGATTTSTTATDSTEPAPTTDPQVAADLARMSLRDKAGQVLVPMFAGTDAPDDLIEGVEPGGIIYFSENLTSDAQATRLSRDAQDASQLPLLVMTDQEGGLVSRMPGMDEPAGEELDGDTREARRVARRMAVTLDADGLNTDLAPVADVNTVGDAGVIGDRSFGSTPGVVSPMVRAQICGFHRGGVAAAAKHFPGHGSTAVDSHEEMPTLHMSRSQWRRTDLPPFRAAVKAGADMILVGHLAFPALDPSGRPATISRKLNHDLIRGMLGFDGVVVTDALNMGGVTTWGDSGTIAVKSLRAGSDLLLMPPKPSMAVREIVAAVRDGRLPRARLDDAVRRVLTMKHRLGLFGGAPQFPSC